MSSLDTQLMHSHGAWTTRTPRALELLAPVLSSVVKERRLAPYGGPWRVAFLDEHGSSAFLENFIASTSIFVCENPSYEGPTVDALATGTDEGRGRLRKATGRCLPTVDP